MKTAIRSISISLFFFVAGVGISPAGSPQRFSGVVDTVFDGDLIRVTLDEGQKIPAAYTTCSKVYSTMAWVRLYAIKAPDPLTKHPCGKEAKEFVKKLAQGRRVSVDVTGCPPDGGLGGVVTVQGGTFASKDITLELVKAGLARVGSGDAAHAGLVGKYYEAEKKAMMDGLGLWGKKPCGKK